MKNKKQLPETAKRIYKGNKTNKFLVFADKTSDIYKLDTYKKLSTEAVILTY